MQYPEYAYVENFTGYFVAPRTGDYIFRGLADDFLEVYISPVTGSKEIDYTRKLISSTSNDPNSNGVNFFLVNQPTMTSAPITMNAGDAYYMEVYHFNTGGLGSFKVAVEVPNTDPWYPNTVFEVQRFALQPQVVA